MTDIGDQILTPPPQASLQNLTNNSEESNSLNNLKRKREDEIDSNSETLKKITKLNGDGEDLYSSSEKFIPTGDQNYNAFNLSHNLENKQIEQVEQNSNQDIQGLQEKAMNHVGPQKDILVLLEKNIQNIFRYSRGISYPNPTILTYVTPYNMANQLIEWMDSIFNLHYRSPYNQPYISNVIDFTACVGGNALEFGRRYKNASAFEIDKESFECLEKNIKLYRLDKKMRAYNQNSMDWLFDTQRQTFKFGTCIFYDPPWGGSDYKEKKIIPDLPMASTSGKKYGTIDIVKRCFQLQVSMLCIKLPYNFDVDLFRQEGFKRTYEMRYNKCIFVIVFPTKKK